MTEIAQIFLAEQRGCSETAWFRSIHSFNFGNYQDPSRKPFGALKLWNDETLAAQKSLSLTVEEDITLVILPIVGGVELKYLGESNFVAAGQALSLCLNVGATYQITNLIPTNSLIFCRFG
ncbi:MAG: hypothetical protein R2822_01175 [Spirosomataceae bacterium]